MLRKEHGDCAGQSMAESQSSGGRLPRTEETRDNVESSYVLIAK